MVLELKDIPNSKVHLEVRCLYMQYSKVQTCFLIYSYVKFGYVLKGGVELKFVFEQCLGVERYF